MASKGCYTQSGKILAVTHDTIRIGFVASSACSSCSARAKCGMSESSEREIEIPTPSGEDYKVGDSVQIAISSQMGTISVVVAYVLPLIVLMVMLSVLITLGLNEGLSALISIAGVAVYYIGIYLNRAKLENKIKFTIKK